MSMRNLPTIITSTRFILAGIVAWLICYDSNFFTLISVILFVAGSLSDALDGAIARRQENPSKFGAFLDPIADKFLVFLVLISLVFNRDSNALFVISVVIISREILIMSLREWMATSEKGRLIEVSSLGKVKTIIQMSGISLVVGAPLVKDSTLAIWTYFHEFSLSVLLIGAIIGVYSAFKYLKESYSYLY